MAAGYVFIYTVVAFDEFCKTAVTQLGVRLGCIDEIEGNDLPHRFMAIGAARQRVVFDGLFHLDYLAPVTRAAQMLVLVYRHSIPPGSKNMGHQGAPFMRFHGRPTDYSLHERPCRGNRLVHVIIHRGAGRAFFLRRFFRNHRLGGDHQAGHRSGVLNRIPDHLGGVYHPGGE